MGVASASRPRRVWCRGSARRAGGFPPPTPHRKRQSWRRGRPRATRAVRAWCSSRSDVRRTRLPARDVRRAHQTAVTVWEGRGGSGAAAGRGREPPSGDGTGGKGCEPNSTSGLGQFACHPQLALGAGPRGQRVGGCASARHPRGPPSMSCRRSARGRGGAGRSLSSCSPRTTPDAFVSCALESTNTGR